MLLPLASTLLLLVGLVPAAVPAAGIRAPSVHRGLAERLAFNSPIQLSKRQIQRRSCRAPSSGSSGLAAATAVSTSSTIGVAVATSSTEQVPTTTPAATTVVEKHETSTSAQRSAATTAAAGGSSSSSNSGTSSSSSSSGAGGHLFTLTNNCPNVVNPMIVSTACGYSPRCSDASTAALPSVGSLAAGKTTTVTLPKDFVGRIFSQNGSCGPKGEDCTMLEFNLDADSFYTPQSYDISNIQAFTQSIFVGAEGCASATCTSASCSCQDAYPIGDETGCGADLPVKACGAGAIPFTVVFCP